MFNEEMFQDKHEKKTYDVFCQKVYVPIYSQPWWLDAVCLPQNWNVHVIAESGQYIAAMPYYVAERCGYKIITKAHLTQTNGIIINYPVSQKYCKRLDMDEKVINEMSAYIDELKVDKYEQQFPPEFTNWLPYRWKGYNETTRFTYIIKNTSDMENVRSQFSYQIRNKLKNAKKIVHLDENMEVDKFYSLIKTSCERDGDEISYSRQLLIRLYDACKQRNCCKILAAKDDEGRYHAAAFFVWDKKNVYYLIGGSNPELRSSQANAFLIEKGIELAGSMGKAFDFEGSMIQGIERAYRAYGAEQVRYYRIYKTFNIDMQENQVNHWSKEELGM